MAHNVERPTHAAVDALVHTANAAPNKRLSNIFLIINFTHFSQVSPAAPRALALQTCCGGHDASITQPPACTRWSGTGERQSARLRT